MKKATTSARPMPPDYIGQLEDGHMWPTTFFPAPDVRDWLIDTFIDQAGVLFNEDHAHLAGADFEVLWAASSFPKQGRTVVGQAEELNFRSGGWQKERQEHQMGEWFGRLPTFLLTFSAEYARECADDAWCALVEHELYHLGHKRDEFDDPIWTKAGLPKLFIRGHDVEEFVGVVKRYGVGPAGGSLSELVKAANQRPQVSRYQLSKACGTCLLRAA